MSSEKQLLKIAEVVKKQQNILSKIAQQIIDTSPNTSPTHPADALLNKIVHDATTTWATQNRMSTSSSFNAGTDGKNYEVDVVLTITDPKKPLSNTPAGQKTLALFKQSFLNTLQATYDKESRNTSSPLAGVSATFNVSVK